MSALAVSGVWVSRISTASAFKSTLWVAPLVLSCDVDTLMFLNNLGQSLGHCFSRMVNTASVYTT